MKETFDAALHVIKRYAGSRFYDTTELAYVSVEGIRSLLRMDAEVVVMDAETGVDITQDVLQKRP